MTRSWVWGCILLIGLAAFVKGAPIFISPRQLATAIKRQLPGNSVCSIEGNQDFYGLGIRIGVYLQWITTFCANLFLREAIETNIETSTIFLLALFVATAVATGEHGVQTPEVLVLLQLCFGFIFSILSVWGHRTRSAKGSDIVRFPLIGSFVRLTITTALSGYALWFWFWGRGSLRPDTACTDYMFLFFKADASRGARIFFQIQSTLILAAYGWLFARELLMIVCFFFFVAMWTTVLAIFTACFGASGVKTALLQSLRAEMLVEDGKMTSEDMKERNRQSIGSIAWGLTRQWFRLVMAIMWKQANGKESAGPHRPYLAVYVIPFYDIWILSVRTFFQYLCLVICKRAPPIDFPPMLEHPYVKLMKTSKNEDPPVGATFRERYDNGKKAEEMDQSLPTKLINALESKSVQRAVWITNGLCIVWSILSIELTLVWNNISGVYVLSSTGQLIPFITGVVSSLSFLHGMSINLSKKRSTDVLLELLDTDPLTEEIQAELESRDGPGEESAEENESNEDSFSLHDGHEAVFWTRKPERRRSFSTITREHIDADVKHPINRNYEALFHLHHAHDARELWKRYSEENIEQYHLSDGTQVYFVIDYRRSLKHSTETLSHASSYHGASSRSSSSSSSSLRCRRRNDQSRSRSRSRDSAPQSTRSQSLPYLSTHSRSRSRSRSMLATRRSRGSQNSVGAASRQEGSSAEQSDGGIESLPERAGKSSRRRRRRARSSSRSTVRPASGGSNNSLPKQSLRRVLISGLRLLFKSVLMILVLIWMYIFQPIANCLLPRVLPRLRFAGQELWKRLKVHFREEVKWSSRYRRDKGATKTEEQKKPKPKKSRSAHVRYKNPLERFKQGKYGLRKALKTLSLARLVDAIVFAMSDICEYLHMPQTSANVKSFKVLWDEAKSVREMKRNGEIGRTVQHEMIAEQWKRFWNMKLVWTAFDEFGWLMDHLESKERYGWDEDSLIGKRKAFSNIVIDVSGFQRLPNGRFEDLGHAGT